MSKKADLNLIKDCAAKGYTVSQIVQETGYSEMTVRKWIKKEGISVFSKKAVITPEVEQQMIDLNAKGYTNKQIADELHMASFTVRTYLKRYNKDFNSERMHGVKSRVELSQLQKDILYGTLLGDASIEIYWKNARFTFSQGGAQEKYFDYKCSFFSGLLGKINKTPRYDKRTDKWYNKFVVRSFANPYYTELYKDLYINGVKTVTQQWCDKLTPIGLAFWFMDDGNNSGVIATNSFSLDEVILLQKTLLEKWDIQTTIQKQVNNDHLQYLLYIRRDSRYLFYDLVIPYFIPEMEYKLENWS